MDSSSECNGGLHGLCPGYYKMTYTCRCTCHRPLETQGMRKARLMAEEHEELRCPTEEHESDGPPGGEELERLFPVRPSHSRFFRLTGR